MTAKTTSGKTMPDLPSIEDLDFALYEMERYFEQVMVPFYLIGESLTTVKDKGQVDGHKIELLTLERYLTKEVRSFFKGWGFTLNAHPRTVRKIKHNIKGIPVEIKVLKRRPKWLEHPDTTWYKVTQFMTPNPWRAAL